MAGAESAKSRDMRVRQISSLFLLAIVGCGPLKTVTDIYSPESPKFGSGRTVNRVSTGDPTKLEKQSSRPSDNPELTY